KAWKGIAINTTLIVQQSVQVTGSVVSGTDGAPLPGASVVEKGTSNGVSTDFDGNFSISVSDKNAILVVSYLGFVTQEIRVPASGNINISLVENAQGLD